MNMEIIKINLVIITSTKIIQQSLTEKVLFEKYCHSLSVTYIAYKG